MSDVVTVSGSDRFAGPLPVVRQAAAGCGLEVAPVVFDGDAADRYDECRETVRAVVRDDAPVAVAGFSAGAHLALDLVQEEPSLFPRGAVVLAFDPPDVMRIGGGASQVSPVEPLPQDIVAIYPSVRDATDRVEGACRVREIRYDEFPYTAAEPSDEEYSRMDRAHRFKDREDAVRSLVAEEFDRLSPRRATDGTPAPSGQ